MSAAKKKDLMSLCISGVTPALHKHLFEALPCSTAMHEETFEAAADDSDAEIEEKLMILY